MTNGEVSAPADTRVAGAAGGVRVDSVDVGGLCGAGLRASLGEISRAESQLAGMKADVLGEVERRGDDDAAEHAAKVALSVSGRQARSDVNNAVAVGELEAARGGLADGRMPAGHARLIARASKR